ncbi:hypothetical protein GN956_G19571 [Arapaima gigas]
MEERLSNSMAATPRLGSRLAWHDAGRHGSGAGSSGQSQMNLGPGCLQQTRARRKLPLPTMVEENGATTAASLGIKSQSACIAQIVLRSGAVFLRETDATFTHARAGPSSLPDPVTVLQRHSTAHFH